MDKQNNEVVQTTTPAEASTSVDASNQESVETNSASNESPEKATSSEVSESVNDDGGGLDEVSDLVKSERGQKRVQKLANERTALAQENEKLKETLSKYEPLVESRSNEEVLQEIESNNDDIYTGDYISDLKLVQERATKDALKKVEERAKKAKQRDSEIRALESKYPELRASDDNDKYDPDLAAQIVELFSESEKANKNIRLKPFVERIMAIRATSANNSAKEVAESITEAVKDYEDNSAVTPSSASKTKKSYKEMGLSELEALAGYAS